MKKYIVRWHAGMCGTDEARCIIAENQIEAVNAFISEAWEHFWNHNDQDPESYEDDIGTVDGMEAELDIWAEKYDPKKHDGLRCGGDWDWEE